MPILVGFGSIHIKTLPRKFLFPSLINFEHPPPTTNAVAHLCQWLATSALRGLIFGQQRQVFVFFYFVFISQNFFGFGCKSQFPTALLCSRSPSYFTVHSWLFFFFVNNSYLLMSIGITSIGIYCHLLFMQFYFGWLVLFVRQQTLSFNTQIIKKKKSKVNCKLQISPLKFRGDWIPWSWILLLNFGVFGFYILRF